MKILQINNGYSKSGGVEVVFSNTIRLLKENGCEVIPFCVKDLSNNSLEYEKYFVENKPSLLSKFYSFEAKKKLKQTLQDEKPDIAHIHNIFGGITFSVISEIKKMKIPIVASIHNFRYLCPVYIFLDRDGKICEKCGNKKFYHCTLKNCSPEGYFRSSLLTIESYLRERFYPFESFVDRFIFVSNFTKQKYLEYYPQIENISEVIYNFTLNFKPCSSHKDYFLYFGRLAREKGLNTLLKAFKSNPESKLKIVGNGPLMEEIKLNKSANVELIGFKSGEELSDLIMNAKFVIIPSECYETLSMSAVESLSFGKPIIGSNIGAISEIIQDGATGFLFQAKDENELSSLVEHCSNLSDEKYQEFSNSSFNYAVNNFSASVHLNKLTSLYEKILSNKRN